ncbi:UNVERIFIED_CONTAM: hypothetical protein HDU68_011463 [Siphonaria sp. JEL0065]|nr:hypothetical protein HDU68_011463 [Siphonaria sp. JEL0065]
MMLRGPIPQSLLRSPIEEQPPSYSTASPTSIHLKSTLHGGRRLTKALGSANAKLAHLHCYEEEVSTKQVSFLSPVPTLLITDPLEVGCYRFGGYFVKVNGEGKNGGHPEFSIIGLRGAETPTITDSNPPLLTIKAEGGVFYNPFKNGFTYRWTPRQKGVLVLERWQEEARKGIVGLFKKKEVVSEVEVLAEYQFSLSSGTIRPLGAPVWESFEESSLIVGTALACTSVRWAFGM